MLQSLVPPRLRDQRGVALPLALAGLVGVTLLVTTALVTSSTEFAISQAHQDATASLYDSEGALQQYIAAKAQAAATPPNGLAPAVQDPLISGSLVTVTRLQSRQETLPNAVIRQYDTYSLVAEPASGRGRVVGVQISAERTASFFNINVNAGLTVGGDLSVGGNSTVSDGRGAACDSAAAPNALQVSTGSTVTKTGSATIEGKADTATYTKEQMVELLLGGLTLEKAVELATVKFAPGTFSGRVRSHDGSTPLPRTDNYNWGCPVASADGCNTVPGNESNRSYYPIVAIDAGGGTVTLEGNHGQGILIVHNGSLHVKGNFTYTGIVLVQRDLTVQGTGSGAGAVKLEGAVVALGENSVVKDNTTGNAVITYNKCTITAAEANANAQAISAAPQTFPYAAVSWQEVVR